MTIIHALILGVVQGLTEFLPVSSSGHLALAQVFWGFDEPQLFFDTMLHVATLFAVLLAFRRAIIDILKNRDLRFIGLIVLASIPTAVIGFLLKDSVESAMGIAWLVAAMLLVTGGVLIVSSMIAAREKEVSWSRALLIGIAQGLAVMPGISRSGITISAGIATGVQPVKAAKFSFLLSIPAILGAAVLQLKEVSATEINWIPTLLGMIAAFISGFVAIKWLISTLKSGRYRYFGYYCITVALLAFLIDRIA